MHDEVRFDMNRGFVFVADSDYGYVEFVTGIGKKAKETGKKLHAIACITQAHAAFAKEIPAEMSRTPQGASGLFLRRILTASMWLR